MEVEEPPEGRFLTGAIGKGNLEQPCGGGGGGKYSMGRCRPAHTGGPPQCLESPGSKGNRWTFGCPLSPVKGTEARSVP